MSPAVLDRAYRLAHLRHDDLERRLGVLLRWRAVGPAMDELVRRHRLCHLLIARIHARRAFAGGLPERTAYVHSVLSQFDRAGAA